jgi:hypothetical protein
MGRKTPVFFITHGKSTSLQRNFSPLSMKYQRLASNLPLPSAGERGRPARRLWRLAEGIRLSRDGLVPCFPDGLESPIKRREEKLLSGDMRRYAVLSDGFPLFGRFFRLVPPVPTGS